MTRRLTPRTIKRIQERKLRAEQGRIRQLMQEAQEEAEDRQKESERAFYMRRMSERFLYGN